MIDLALLRSEPERVRESQRMRGDDVEVVDQVLAADARRRTSLTDFEQARAEQKSLGREVAQAKGDEKAVLLARTKDLAQQVKALQAAADAAGAEARELLMSIGNLAEPGVPAGGADDFTVLREEGTPRDFASEGVTVRDHLELGEGLKAIDMERGAKVSGARFYFLTGVGAQLELAILNAAMGVATANGFSPMITPTLVRPETMRGTGFLGSHSDEVYYLEKDELYLTGTSEVALAGYHTDEILDLNEGPLRYAGWSACYRREAGSAGRDTRGIIRVHQFHKVEMFSYVRSEDAAAEHERFLTIQESMLKALE
ncbi:MAG: serine--tRNA ligase, partial [Actinobacteria bacterium HGW-Actinobacteria-8]